jgi:hypothetical protein
MTALSGSKLLHSAACRVARLADRRAGQRILLAATIALSGMVFAAPSFATSGQGSPGESRIVYRSTAVQLDANNRLILREQINGQGTPGKVMVATVNLQNTGSTDVKITCRLSDEVPGHLFITNTTVGAGKFETVTLVLAMSNEQSGYLKRGTLTCNAPGPSNVFATSAMMAITYTQSTDYQDCCANNC